MLERFDVRRRLETPGGIRYGAVDTHLGSAARLQRIPEDGSDYVVDDAAFAEAAVRLPALNHPKLVPVLELGYDEDGAYAACAYAEGETLTEWIIAHGRLSVKDTISVATDCLLGLAALEAEGLRHGDPHPHRIVLKRGAQQRLDARLAEAGLALLSHPKEAGPPGTAIQWRDMGFAAPEVIAQEASDARADLHTLGCTLYLCLTGSAPFVGENEDAVAHAHLTTLAVPILQRRREVPPRVAEWVMTLLASRPDDRPASAQLALMALETALGRKAAPSHPKVAAAAPWPPVAPVQEDHVPMMEEYAPAEDAAIHEEAAPPDTELTAAETFPWEEIVAPAEVARPLQAIGPPWPKVPSPWPWDCAPVKPRPASLPTHSGSAAAFLWLVVIAALVWGTAWAWRNYGPPSANAVPGRYVRIELPRGNPLTLAEVQVFSRGRNIAPQGRATQSSTAFGGNAQRAIDGQTNGNYQAGSSSHTTGRDPQTWWEVDLQSEQPLDALTVWNRTDEGGRFAGRLGGFQVIVLDAARRETFRSPANPAPRESVRIELSRTSSDSRR